MGVECFSMRTEILRIPNPFLLLNTLVVESEIIRVFFLIINALVVGRVFFHENINFTGTKPIFNNQCIGGRVFFHGTEISRIRGGRVFFHENINFTGTESFLIISAKFFLRIPNQFLIINALVVECFSMRNLSDREFIFNNQWVVEFFSMRTEILRMPNPFLIINLVVECFSMRT